MDRRTRRLVIGIASRQHGLATRPQIDGLAVSRGSVDRAVASEFLIPVAPGVYRLPGAPQTIAMATMAAVLAAEGRASHATAGRLLRLGVPGPAVPVHVTVDGTQGHPRVDRVAVADPDHAFFAVTVHRHRDRSEPVVEIDGIPCTDAARTLIDVAQYLDQDELADAFDRARDLGLVSVDSLARRFACLGGRGRPGTPKVRRLLEHAPPRALQSRLERLAARLVEGSGLPRPVRQYTVTDIPGRYRLDFAWPELLAAWETEGFEWHGTRARWKQDRIRVGAIERRGWRHMVASWDDITSRPEETVERLAVMLQERRVLAAAGALTSFIVR
jgi:hypothetical protein